MRWHCQLGSGRAETLYAAVSLLAATSLAAERMEHEWLQSEQSMLLHVCRPMQAEAWQRDGQRLEGLLFLSFEVPQKSPRPSLPA